MDFDFLERKTKQYMTILGSFPYFSTPLYIEMEGLCGEKTRQHGKDQGQASPTLFLIHFNIPVGCLWLFLHTFNSYITRKGEMGGRSPGNGSHDATGESELGGSEREGKRAAHCPLKSLARLPSTLVYQDVCFLATEWNMYVFLINP